MGDLTKILGGTVDEVKAAMGGLSHVDLQELRKQEDAGKKRVGVLSAIDDALDSEGESDGAEGEAEPGLTGYANDSDIPPATDIDTSGAPQQIVPDVDMSHPAVDSDPRAHTGGDQNRIDFNDPSLDGREVVSRALGMKTKSDA